MTTYAPTMLALGADQAMHLRELVALRVSDILDEVHAEGGVQENAATALDVIDRLTPIRGVLVELSESRLALSTDCRDVLRVLLAEDDAIVAAEEARDTGFPEDKLTARWRRDIVAGHLARVELALVHQRIDAERGSGR